MAAAESSTLRKFFLGSKAKIDSSKFDYKETLNYRWYKFTKAFSHLFLRIIYNTFFAIGWVSVIKTFSTDTNSLQSMQSGAEAVGYGVGHLAINAVHGTYNWIIEKVAPSVKKDELKDGSAVPTLKTSSVLMWFILMLPLIMWLIGKIVIHYKVKKYKLAHNGSLLTQKQLDAQTLMQMKTEANKTASTLVEKKQKTLETLTKMLDNTTTDVVD